MKINYNNLKINKFSNELKNTFYTLYKLIYFILDTRKIDLIAIRRRFGLIVKYLSNVSDICRMIY